MKRILFSLLVSFITVAGYAQTTAFSEDFELPSGADSVTSVGTPGWTISTTLASQGVQSMRGQYGVNDSTTLTSNVFSTVGNTFIKLQFWHIAKIEFFDFAVVQVSNNGGSTWTTLTCPDYLGTGNFCASGNKFASNTYLDWLPANATATPTNAWWKYEEFDVSPFIANSPNARIRFLLYDANFSGIANNYGWLVDDIRVIQAPCEIVSPSVSLNVPVYQGNVFSGGPFNISANITDASGVDSAIVVYTVNAGIPDTILMTTTTGSNTYTATIPSQTVGATVCYTVYAWDASPCGNQGFAPAGGSNCFTISFTTPPWCTGAMISTFPYTQNFETFTAGTGASGATVYGTLAGNWTRNPGPSTAFGWGVRQGTTASAGTGPNTDNTLQTATGKYMFVEANNGTVGAEATLVSPCLDFSNLVAPKMDFYYHMFGPGIGTLSVEIYNGFVWTSVWSLTGQQQSSSAAPYFKQTVDLSSAGNSIVQVRFKATRTNNTIGDIAIDDVYIYEPQPNDVGVIGIVAPNNAGCNLTSTEQVTVRVANMGTSPQANIPVAFQINGGAPLVEAIFQTLQPGDTVLYTFNATANLSTPAATYTFNAFTLLTGEQTPSNDSVVGYQVVNTLQTPAYFQNFDNFSVGQITSGSWVQDTGDQFNWSFKNGTTPTANTGPPGDHTSGTGMYAYIERDGPAVGAIANLVTPCIDLRTLLAPKLEFWYHMFGTTMGTLNVQVFDSTNSWVTVWTLSGNQGNQWIKALVNLNQFAGQIVLIRFQAINANCCTGDMAIDDVLVFEPQPDDLGIIGVSSPLNGSCGYSTAPVSIQIVNFGTASQSVIPVAYAVNGGAPVLDTLFQLMAPGDTVSFTFSQQVNLAGQGQNFNISIYTNLSTDSTAYNDTALVVINHPTAIGVFPHLENFESFTAGTGIPTTNPGTLNNQWTRNPDGTVSQFMWHVKTGGTGSTTTGPIGDNTSGLNGLGKYMYTEVSYGATGNIAYLTSPCLNLSGLTSPRVEYSFHRFGANMGKLVLEILVGTNWVPVDSIQGQQQTAQTQPYQTRIVNIGQAGGTFSRIRFRAHHNGCCNGDMAIDDVRIYQPMPQDASCIAVLLPVGQSAAGSNTVCQIQVRNLGTDTLFAMNLGYTVNGVQGALEPWTGILPPLATFNYTFTTTFAAPTGQYAICGFSALTGDQVPSNDTTCGTSIGVPVLGLPYFTNFESGVQSWVSEGGFQQWQLGAPNYAPITSAFSPTNAWMTNLTGIYQNNSNDFLYTPLFDFSGILGATLSFRNNYNTENTWDGGNIQYSVNGGTTWTVLGSVGAAGAVNWYNGANLIGLSQPGWMGSSNGWQLSSIPLSLFNNSLVPVRFRFRFGSDPSVNGYAGWAIDDFEISIPVQHSAAATEIIVIPSNFFILPAVKTVSAWLKNTGIHPLQNLKATLEIDQNIIVTDSIVLSTPLPQGDSILHVFSMPWSAAPGLHDICVYTSLPNTFNDNFTPDDTSCYQVTVFDSLSTFPYCNDFEGSLPPLVTLNTETYTPTGTLWGQGTPSTPFLNNAYSGSQCWTTNMNGNYNNQDSSALYTPVFNVRNDSCYRLSFYHKFKTEIYQDGGIVEFSQDGGSTWTKVGGVNSSWYNTAYVTGLSNTTPGDNGWSGQSSGWIYSEATLLFPQAGSAIIRFRFGSDLSITDEGWSIDNMCFEQIAPCTPTSVEEIPLWVNSIYPNPSTGPVEISINSLVGGAAQIEVVNLMGQTLYRFEEKFAADQNVLKYDLGALANGVYYVKVNHGGHEVVEKLVISK
jgi:hypothetical protein